MTDQLITTIFNANLGFSALLFAVLGILVSLYVRAEHEKWKRKFRILLILIAGAFFLGIVKCLLSFFYILHGFPSASTMVFNLIAAVFVSELALLGFTGLFLVITLVTE